MSAKKLTPAIVRALAAMRALAHEALTERAGWPSPEDATADDVWAAIEWIDAQHFEHSARQGPRKRK